MKTYVAFLRAINVAGHASVKMEDVKKAFAQAKCKNVRTYIQSGNVIFDTAEDNSIATFENIRRKIGKLIGTEPTIVFRTKPQLANLIKLSPFADDDGKTKMKFYVAFLADKPAKKPQFPVVSEKECLEAFGMKTLDVFITSHKKKNGGYGFPNNFIEKEFGVAATTRNWSTVSKIGKLLTSSAPKTE